MQTKTKAAIQLLALVGIAVVVVTLRWSWPEQNEFRGKLRYPVLHIGGEGSDAILDTGTKAFDLLFQSRADWRPRLEELADKRIVVIGRSRVVHGIERLRYDAIEVIQLTGE